MLIDIPGTHTRKHGEVLADLERQLLYRPRWSKVDGIPSLQELYQRPSESHNLCSTCQPSVKM